MTDIKPQNPTMVLVPDWYYDAFAMRILGRTYKEIAKKLGKNYDHVRSLFARGGKLYPFWREYVEVKKQEGVERAMDMMWSSLPEIIKTRIDHAKTFEPGAVDSTKLIMAHTIGDPGGGGPTVQNNTIINTQINIIPENQKQMIRAAFANFGIIKRTQNNGQSEPTINREPAGGDIQQPESTEGDGQ